MAYNKNLQTLRTIQMGERGWFEQFNSFRDSQTNVCLKKKENAKQDNIILHIT